MDYTNLNETIKYIEKNLEEKIDLKEISKIVGLNEFIFDRIFIFLTGMTLTEYIKKRRLSKALEEIKKENTKIIDIAIKYQYSSVSSFNRAFKKLFNTTPTDARKKKQIYQIIPIIDFKNLEKNVNHFSFEIQNIEKINLFCYHITSDDHENLIYKIRKLYKNIQVKEEYKKFNTIGMYGICEKKARQYHYYVGSKIKYDYLTKYTIQKGKYVVFKLNSREQKEIINLEERIDRQWFSSTAFKEGKNTNFEYYEGEHCYIYISIN